MELPIDREGYCKKGLKEELRIGEPVIYGNPNDFKFIRSLGNSLGRDAARLHHEAQTEASRAETARLEGDNIAATTLFSSAFQKEKQVAEMLEPGMQVEPIRSFLHLNAARLAIEFHDMESARHMAADAMRGIPPTDLLDDFRQVLEASSRPEAPAPQGEQIADDKARYRKKPTTLTTNLSRRNRFLGQFLTLLPEAEMVDIITSDFEIASYLLFSGLWQFATQIRMVIGHPRPHPGHPGPALINTGKQDLAIEREKARTDDVSGLYAVKAAIAEGRLQIGVHTKDEIHGAAYIIRTRDGGIHGYIGSAEFTQSGLIHPLQLMAAVTDGHCTELARLFDFLHASSHKINEPLTALIDRHLREYTPYQVYLNNDTLFRETVVQRSRTYVKKREQSSETTLAFPERQAPRVAAYSLQQTYGPLLSDLRRAFDRDDPLLRLPIYYPMAYARRPAESVEDRKEENRQRQVVGLVRTTMLKRFESSWKAFQYTCEDFLLKVIAAHRQLDERRYEKWRDANALWLHEVERHMAQRYDQAVDAEDVEEDDLLSAFMDRDFSLDKRLFKVKEMVADMEQDMALLITFLSRLRGLSATQDTKVQALLEMLQKDPLLSKHKVVVFTEFRDKARYLFETLKTAGIPHLFEIDSTSKVDRLDVIRRFAPFYNYHDEAILQKALAGPIRVLISTDILAEGLNLQDAFLMINYDLHWNPVRLMQRIGRVDRRMNPDTEARILQNNRDEKGLRGKMWFWNFLPPAELNDLLSLYHRVSHKVLRISETTGQEAENGLKLVAWVDVRDSDELEDSSSSPTEDPT